MSVLDAVYYDETSPSCLRWKADYGKRAKAGAIVGWQTPLGYFRFEFKRKSYATHRVVWMLHNPELEPCEEIDHIDGGRSNNRIANLRTATRQTNVWNTAKSSRNTSGVKGVSWHKANRKWTAYVAVNGIRQYLGIFEHIEDAELAVRKRRAELHLEFTNHGEHACQRPHSLPL